MSLLWTSPPTLAFRDQKGRLFYIIQIPEFFRHTDSPPLPDLLFTSSMTPLHTHVPLLTKDCLYLGGLQLPLLSNENCYKNPYILTEYLKAVLTEEIITI